MHYTIMSIVRTSPVSLIFHTEYLKIMNLSIFELAYLGSQAKDTPHSGQNQILRYGSAQILPEPTDDLWMRDLGLLTQPDRPLARLLWEAEVANTKQASQDTYSLLLAQPVHLSLQRDSFALDNLLALTADEYLALTTHLNSFFVEDGITLIPSVTHQYWFLKTPSAWQLTTQPVQAVQYQNIQAWMPQGPDANKLRQIINQVQMLMHEHPLNQKRVQQGLPEVNSIWFSANSFCGQAYAIAPLENTVLIGQNAMTHVISRVCRLPHYADVSTAAKAGAKHAIMLMDQADNTLWDDVYQAVKSRKVQQMTAHFPTVNGTLQVSLSPLDCWKLWRKPNSFESTIKALSRS